MGVDINIDVDIGVNVDIDIGIGICLYIDTTEWGMERKWVPWSSSSRKAGLGQGKNSQLCSEQVQGQDGPSTNSRGIKALQALQGFAMETGCSASTLENPKRFPALCTKQKL